MMDEPLMELEKVHKSYGPVQVLNDVGLVVRAGEVTCLLGDNGAGKSTLIKILSGVTMPDRGTLRFSGRELSLSNPKSALKLGIATVFQDLAVAPVVPVYRNFCMGQEPTRGVWPLRWLDVKRAVDVTRAELAEIGVDVADVHRPIATLSGGQRQCVAIARAVHRGAKVLILDEPTSALGVRQSALVLRYVQRTKERGVGIVLVTHNPGHAHVVGDTFTILKHGRVDGTWDKGDLSVDELTAKMGEEDALLGSL